MPMPVIYDESMRRNSRKLWWILGSSATVVALVVGSFAFYSSFFAAHAAPRVSISGENVTGQTREEIEAKLKAQADALTVEISVDGTNHTAKLGDLGYQLDVQKTTDAAFAASDTPTKRLSSLLNPTDVAPVYTQDPVAVQSYVDSLLQQIGKPAQDASVKLDETTGVFSVVPSQEGISIDSAALAQAAEKTAKTMTSSAVELSTAPVSPAVTTEQAAGIAQAANDIVATPVTVSGEVTSHSATNAEKAAWITIASPAGKLQEPTIDADAVKAWVKATGETTNDKPQPGVRNINSRGDVVSVVSQAVAGWQVTGTDDLAASVVKSLQDKQPFDGTFTYTEVPSDQWEDRQIADGAENLAYQAAAGEKWIDVDLSNFTMSAYEGSTIVQGPIYMVPGATATPTVTGTYSIYAKVPTQTMKGFNVDGTPYETPDVPNAMYFYQDYALHGAYWRSSFGYGGSGGSHGCVNLPLDAAATLYSWAPIGTKVVSHY